MIPVETNDFYFDEEAFVAERAAQKKKELERKKLLESDEYVKLDLLTRLAHPEWFSTLIEWAEIRQKNLQLNRSINQIREGRKVCAMFGRFMAEDFDCNGTGNPPRWWREHITEIAAYSDNSTVQAALADLS